MLKIGLLLTSAVYISTAVTADDPGALYTFAGHDKAVLAVAYSRDGSRLASGSESGLTRIWDPKTGEPVLDMEFQYAVNGLAFTKDGKTLVTGTWGAQVWDLSDGSRKNHLEAHTGFLTCVATSPDGKFVATGGLDSTVKLWDPGNWQELRSLPNRDQVNAISFSGDGAFFAVAGDTAVTIWKTIDWKIAREMKDVPASSVALDKAGERLAIGAPDGSVRVFKTADGKQTELLKPHTSAVNGIVFSPDGKLLATCSADKTARLFLAGDLKGLAVWKHPDAVTSIAFAPDGKTVATGCKDRAARIWRVP